MKKHIGIISIAALWLLIAVGLITVKQAVIYNGTRIILETKPVDPYDILKGDYVRLNYAINTVQNMTLEGNYLLVSRRYYVLLKQDENLSWQVDAITAKRPENKLFIAGLWNGRRMVYGIEEYFVPEGKGRDIERLSGAGLQVEVAVDKNGNSVIVRLMDKGAELKIRDIK